MSNPQHNVLILGSEELIAQRLKPKLNDFNILSCNQRPSTSKLSNEVIVSPEDLFENEKYQDEIEIIVNCLPLKKKPSGTLAPPELVEKTRDFFLKKKRSLWIQPASMHSLEKKVSNNPLSAQNCIIRNHQGIFNYENWLTPAKNNSTVLCCYHAPLYSEWGENGALFRMIDLLEKKALESFLFPFDLDRKLQFLHYEDYTSFLHAIIKKNRVFQSKTGQTIRALVSEEESILISKLFNMLGRLIDVEQRQPLPNIVAKASAQLLSGVHYLTTGNKVTHPTTHIQQFLELANENLGLDLVTTTVGWQPKRKFTQDFMILKNNFYSRRSEFRRRNETVQLNL